MEFRMWSYDLAREQAPTHDHLRRICELSLSSGYNALGLYLEHRFAYPSAPWAAGNGALTPEMVDKLQDEFPELTLVPMINLLGHQEGFLRTEQGRKFAEERLKGLQACPSNPDFLEFADKILRDIMLIFKSPLIHLGGDETDQLGACPQCAARIAEFEQGENIDGKARLYGLHFGELARKALESGRRPAIWADMAAKHPQALDYIPNDTILFHWDYFGVPQTNLGGTNKHQMVLCPSIQTYNAMWANVPQSERNIRAHMAVARSNEQDAYARPLVIGVCVTTWECALFGNYETIFPMVKMAGKLINEETPVHPTAHIKAQIKAPDDESSDTEHAPPVVKLANALVAEAVQDSVRRFTLRQAGKLLELVYEWENGASELAITMPANLYSPLLGRLMAISGMSMMGRNLEQFGQIEGTLGSHKFSYRTRTYHTDSGMAFEGELVDKVPMLQYLSSQAVDSLGAYEDEAEGYGEWARIMGIELQTLGGPFSFSSHRSSLKCRLLLQGNPFLAWKHHASELGGEMGERAIALAERATEMAPNPSARGVSQFLKYSIEFVVLAEQAHQAYAQSLPGVAVSCLAPARQIFEELAKIAQATHLNCGGSLADVERCHFAKEHVERVVRRIRDFGDGALGYLPAFEHLVSLHFVPHDQGAWNLVNAWSRD
ncbi:MAG: family 20 glycosylhydrolase [Armatimonadetes bacterium]|nr:family 20 glycosylhydrolase [Armatimonadota bacterium]